MVTLKHCPHPDCVIVDDIHTPKTEPVPVEDIVAGKAEAIAKAFEESVSVLEQRLEAVATTTTEALNVVVATARKADAELESQVQGVFDRVAKLAEAFEVEKGERKKGDASRAQDPRVAGLKKTLGDLKDEIVKLAEQIEREALAREAGDRKKEE